MTQFDNIFQCKPKSKDVVFEEEEDPVTLAIDKANKEKDEMRQDYEEQIYRLQDHTNDTVNVLQSMVLVARKCPDAFFALLDEEGEDWNLNDLKYVATAINVKLEDVIEQKIRQTSDDNVKEMQPSTAQRLYAYVMMDPNADKKTTIQVISELHKELALLEAEKEEESADKVAPKKSTTSSLRKEMSLLQEVLEENEEEKELSQEEVISENVEVDDPAEAVAVSGLKAEDDDMTNSTVDSDASIDLHVFAHV
mmetsp:Transcript_145211/g.205547  ORF Transcript_145211/g.205547 Transcript_145211/m.205547 type:complete len:252 (+) Transcript_145211:66-821(+)